MAHVSASQLPRYTHTHCTHQEYDDTNDLHHIQHLLGLLNGRDEEESATRSNEVGVLPHTSLMAAGGCYGTDGSVILLAQYIHRLSPIPNPPPPPPLKGGLPQVLKILQMSLHSMTLYCR